MERFAQGLVAGGLALVAGLWLTALAPSRSRAWLAGVAAAWLGVIALGGSIYSQIEY
jgi:hypothetical protein